MVRNQYSRNHTNPPASKVLAGPTNSMRVTKSEVMRLYLLCRLQKQEGSREAPHPYNATPPTKKSAVFSPSVFYNVPRPSLHRCLSKPSCHYTNFTEHMSPGGSDEDLVQTTTYNNVEGVEEETIPNKGTEGGREEKEEEDSSTKISSTQKEEALKKSAEARARETLR